MGSIVELTVVDMEHATFALDQRVRHLSLALFGSGCARNMGEAKLAIHHVTDLNNL